MIDIEYATHARLVDSLSQVWLVATALECLLKEHPPLFARAVSAGMCVYTIWPFTTYWLPWVRVRRCGLRHRHTRKATEAWCPQGGGGQRQKELRAGRGLSEASSSSMFMKRSGRLGHTGQWPSELRNRLSNRALDHLVAVALEVRAERVVPREDVELDQDERQANEYGKRDAAKVPVFEVGVVVGQKRRDG